MLKGLHFHLSLWYGKLMKKILHMTGHRATFSPGYYALKFNPDILLQLEKPKHLFGVTGTNGKTTSSHFIADVLKDKGIKHIHNSYGSNTLEGIVSTLMDHSSWTGKLPYEYGVFEIDERSSPHVYRAMTPEFLLVTNLFRDSYKRNAHAEFIFDLIDGHLPKETTLILNADDLISSRLGRDNRHVTFGIDPLEGEEHLPQNNVVDIENCPVCDHLLRKDFVRYHHIGRFACENCGYANLPRDYAITRIDSANHTCTLSHRGVDWTFTLPSKNIVDLYNLVSSVALLHEAGFSMEELQDSFSRIKVIESRYKEERCGKIDVALLMAKAINPIASSRSFDYIKRQTGRIAVILGNTEIKAGGLNEENIAWLYDIDFHFLNQENIVQFITLGKRHKDVDVRLLLAGVDPKKITSFGTFSPDIAYAIDYENVDKIFILNDTDNIPEMMQVREKVVELAKEAQREN